MAKDGLRTGGFSSGLVMILNGGATDVNSWMCTLQDFVLFSLGCQDVQKSFENHFSPWPTFTLAHGPNKLLTFYFYFYFLIILTIFLTPVFQNSFHNSTSQIILKLLF